jgi:hypothetical protein
MMALGASWRGPDAFAQDANADLDTAVAAFTCGDATQEASSLLHSTALDPSGFEALADRVDGCTALAASVGPTSPVFQIAWNVAQTDTNFADSLRQYAQYLRTGRPSFDEQSKTDLAAASAYAATVTQLLCQSDQTATNRQACDDQTP